MLFQMEHHTAKSKQKGGAFKLHSHPTDFFDDNPYYFKSVLPPSQETKVPQSKPKPFKPSSPAKLAGGSKAGTFDVYPHHSEDPYNSPKMQLGGNGKRKGGVFRSSVGPKSKPTSSTLKQNITSALECAVLTYKQRSFLESSTLQEDECIQLSDSHFHLISASFYLNFYYKFLLRLACMHI
ncbi:UPF0602 protein C4orf47 homolog [Geodia barretti]|uniref:Cilia-and flagella-associated protein 96 n=1 Tax=Geodia barretti TaxID=519541 RepID=A0AA35TS69_GEOBA|nr:UPF0602 protein C4orf47 homolog [Geodia barretti]